MPMYVQVCNDEVLEVFEDATPELVKNDSQEWANQSGDSVTLYEVVAKMEFEPEEEEDEDLDSIEEEEDKEDGLLG